MEHEIKSHKPLFFLRLIFGTLILFEILNLVGVLNLSLTYSWPGLIITALAVWVLIEVMYRKRLLDPSFLFIAIIAILLDAGGDIFKLYTNVPHYAKFLHFTNSALFAVMLLVGIYHYHKRVSGLDYWRTWTTVVAVGAMYDLEEFWESMILHNNRYVGGAAELTDITADFFGVLTVILVVWLIMKFKTKQLSDDKKI